MTFGRWGEEAGSTSAILVLCRRTRAMGQPGGRDGRRGFGVDLRRPSATGIAIGLSCSGLEENLYATKRLRQ